MRSVRRASDTALLADRIAGAAAGCPSVARLADGPIATYLPDHVVRGVAVREGEVRIAVVAVYGPPLAEVGREVRAAASRCTHGLPIDVEIVDVALPGEPVRRR
jgi:hypothetical protein